MKYLIVFTALLGVSADLTARTTDGKPFVVLIAGKPSHEPGGHEHNAGVLLFAKALAQGAPQMVVKTHLNEDWPPSEELDHADTVLLYCDAGGQVVSKDDRLEQFGRQMKRGMGFIALHYALALNEIAPQALEWLGGFKQPHWSVNPTWVAHFTVLPRHPVSRGVKPFGTRDEWYYHMRFTEGAGVLTPVLTDVPPLESVNGGCCGYEANSAVLAEVRAGKQQVVAWAFQRPDGGRSFGFTGGHFHRNWADDNQRKLLLNAILWTAKVHVPRTGVESQVSEADLQTHLDPKPAQ
jgi:hypothetical protein